MKTYQELKDYTEKMIEKAKTQLNGEGVIIDMGDDVKKEGITGYHARQMDGELISGECAAEITLTEAGLKIYNILKKDKNADTKDWELYDMILEAKAEMFPDDEE